MNLRPPPYTPVPARRLYTDTSIHINRNHRVWHHSWGDVSKHLLTPDGELMTAQSKGTTKVQLGELASQEDGSSMNDSLWRQEPWGSLHSSQAETQVREISSQQPSLFSLYKLLSYFISLREPQLKNCLLQIGPWLCLQEMVLINVRELSPL